MECVLYKAMNGAQVNFDKQSLTANNLANVNTPGFRSDMFQAQLSYMVSPTGEQDAYTTEMINGNDFSAGPLMNTGRDLDVAINGQGWFAVRDGSGREAYTRGGDFRMDENGMLVTGAGFAVLGDGGPISIPPAQHVEIGSDGTISVVPLGAGPKELAVLDRLKLVTIPKENLIKGTEGLMLLSKGGSAESDASVMVMNQTLEGSNVSAIEQMVNMIEIGREFETHMNLMSTVSENSEKLAQLLQEG